MSDHCPNCGGPKEYDYVYPVDDQLKETWGISERLRRMFNRREGSLCKSCGVNIRAQGLAQAILHSRHGFGARTLEEWVVLANDNFLRVCELNSCHELHNTLKKIKNYTYAEYGTSSQEDIENLSYKNDSFDLLLHSETIEHVNNPERAINECRRVINDNGLVLYTTPVLWDRLTRRRASINKKGIELLLEPSHHGLKRDDYLVFFEYGRDIDKITKSSLVYTDSSSQNFVFCSTKKGQKISPIKKLTLRYRQKYEESRIVVEV